MIRQLACSAIIGLFALGAVADVGPCGLGIPASECAGQNPKINVGPVVNGSREVCVTFKCGPTICFQVDAGTRDIVTVCVCGCCISFRPCIGYIWSDVDECSDMCYLIL